MTLDGVEIKESKGVFEDGWCTRLAKLDLTALRSGSAISVLVWIPSEAGGTGPSTFTLALSQEPPCLADVPRDSPTAIKARGPISKGDTLSLRIFCENLQRETAGDERELSFVVHALTLE